MLIPSRPLYFQFPPSARSILISQSSLPLLSFAGDFCPTNGSASFGVSICCISFSQPQPQAFVTCFGDILQIMSGRPESSKKAEKRGRKEALSVQAALRNADNIGIRILERAPGDITHDIPDESSEDSPDPSIIESNKSKKTRGETKCDLVTKGKCKVEVQFNERGQPVGKWSEIYSSFVGRLSREMVPITYEDWRLVPDANKDLFWEAISQKFIMDEAEGKTYTLQLMGRLWRAYKSRLWAVQDKPENIAPAQWETFVKQRSSKKFMERSKKFKEMRKQQDLPYTASRKGYARLEDEMKKESSDPASITRVDVWIRGHTKKNGDVSNITVAEYMTKMREIKDSEESTPSSIEKDALAQLLGPERRGRVRGIGSGVTLSKLGAVSRSNGKVAKLEEELASVREEMGRMSNLLKDQKKLIDTLLIKEGNFSGSEQMTTRITTPTSTPTTTPLSTTPQSLRGSTRRGSKCELINWMVSDEVVAIGRWVTDDPNTMVHCVPLGKNASRVWVDEVKEPLALLWRSTFDMETIDEAKGSSIAWPTDHINMIED